MCVFRLPSLVRQFPGRRVCLILFSGLFAAAAEDLRAQDNAPSDPTPVPPFVAAPPKGAAYTVTIERDRPPIAPQSPEGNKPAEPAPPGDEAVAISVWKDAKAQITKVRHADNSVSEGYLFESGFAIRSTRASDKTFIAAEATGLQSSLELFSRAYPGTQWISLPYYVGVEKQKDEVYFRYRKPAKPLPPSANGPPPGYTPFDAIEASALVRVADLFPVKVQLGDATYTYSQPVPWEGTIVLPENFMKTAQDYRRESSIIEAFRRKREAAKKATPPGS